MKLETAAAAAAAKEAKEAARAKLLRARERVLARRLKEREDRQRELAEDKARSEEKAAQARIVAQVSAWLLLLLLLLLLLCCRVPVFVMSVCVVLYAACVIEFACTSCCMCAWTLGKYVVIAASDLAVP